MLLREALLRWRESCDDVGRVVKMAAGMELQLQSVRRNEDFNINPLSSTKQMCLRNGLSNGYHLNQKSGKLLENKSLKTVKVVRVNGSTRIDRITIDPPALPALQNLTGLRSRGNKRSVTADCPRKRRRSPRLDKQYDSDR